MTPSLLPYTPSLLIKKLDHGVTQVWYADDAASSGTVGAVREWWEQLNTLGPPYGYYPNANKTWLITKKEHLQSANEAFENTGIQVTTDGRPYLGSPIGTHNYVESFVIDKVAQWSLELETLTELQNLNPMLLMQH